MATKSSRISARDIDHHLGERATSPYKRRRLDHISVILSITITLIIGVQRAKLSPNGESPSLYTNTSKSFTLEAIVITRLFCEQTITFGIFSRVLVFVSSNNWGVNDGQVANLPSQNKVVPLVNCKGADKVKLYDSDPKVFKAFANTNVEFNSLLELAEYLSKLQDPGAGESWVKTNVQPFLLATKITSIAVGNQVLTSGLLTSGNAEYQTALVNVNLD